jgi:hypothetical protein
MVLHGRSGVRRTLSILANFGPVQTAPGHGAMLGTWTMFFAFTAIPVGLFFILDRTGAVHDTSLFAALLVGFGYQQILSGQISSATATAEVSSLWKPFVRWSDWMAARIGDRVARNDGRFAEELIADAVKDDTKFKALRNLALQHANDPIKLTSEIHKIQTDSAAAKLSPEVICDRQARALYFSLKAFPDYQYLLVKGEVLTHFQFYQRTGKLRGGVIAYGLTLLIFGFFGVAITSYAGNVYPPFVSHLYVWRLAKANTSDADKFRTNEQLVAYLADPAMARPVCSELAALLRYEPLSTNAADRDLAILLAGSPAGANCHDQLHDQLIDALRAQNADVRSRINESLVWLYSQDKPESKIPDDLKNWRPKPNEAAYAIEDYIAKWHLAWMALPTARK